ncbi:class I mannose-6-phosphate isomerase [Qipengyuania citrea]|uniref:class I mannose-6-phosphate isomerase n=1 Tax=Qipengyuania citrea TaxID=225971 RepID=UPI003296A44C
MSTSLPKKVVEKVWGRNDLPDYFGGYSSRQIGEIWFEPPTANDGLLVKYLFTSEKLSVQVHPSDQDAQSLGLGERGKEECWLVLEAEAGAAVALGLNGTHDLEEVHKAAVDGSIEDMLVWHDAKVGDFFHVPAGTIHAIGPGLVLLEVQQNTDITFRLFDYGRPRELHLDQALQCAKLEPYSGSSSTSVGERSEEILLDNDALVVKMLTDQQLLVAPVTSTIIPLSGHIEIGRQILEKGNCVVMEAGEVLRSSASAKFLVVNDKQNALRGGTGRD